MGADARPRRGRKFFMELGVASSVFVAVCSLAATDVRAASYATAYDMDIFLNQAHPFDVGTDEPPAYSTDGIVLGAPAAAPSMDDGDEMDGMDDLVAGDEGEGNGDPLEPMNRFIFGFNSIINDFIFSPLAHGYNSVMPDFARESISSFLGNLSSPVVLANDIMQLEFGRAYRTAERTLINSTIGIGGIWDAASWMGRDAHKEDFGQTLGAYGVGEGFYLVLPILGPSNPRDAVGRFGVDYFLDPVGLWLNNTDREDWQWARRGAEGFAAYADIVNELDTLEETSMDFYAAVRSFYRQKRQAEIRNQDGSGGASGGGAGIDLDFEEIP
jgi:phospholipid-binding lipoprotein MlaA